MRAGRASRNARGARGEPKPYLETSAPSSQGTYPKYPVMPKVSHGNQSIYQSDLGNEGLEHCVMVRNRVL